MACLSEGTDAEDSKSTIQTESGPYQVFSGWPPKNVNIDKPFPKN